ncbi:MAG: hypothetical protein J2P28_01930 [Actinobacteria bacterium]|nr:hypothetical protein [Actinomycetota bacterium]MBO0831487.1 hypothetical protein [Actinomycetota bacterium]MBO0834260.1 hypothetical protein [Actinomycetota bacterium]
MPERGRHAHAAKSWLDVGVTGTQAGAGTAAISVVALALLAAAVAGAGGTASSGSTAANQASAGGGLRTGKVDGTTVLTNAAGKTLYWFAPDSKTKSTCYGSCAVYWPPVTGPLTAPAGLPGTLGTIHRTDGTLQETYNGHPLYTYVGDSKPGQNHGNNVNLNGGFWYQIVVKG